jgi:hypothetical protein
MGYKLFVDAAWEIGRGMVAVGGLVMESARKSRL